MGDQCRSISSILSGLHEPFDVCKDIPPIQAPDSAPQRQTHQCFCWPKGVRLAAEAMTPDGGNALKGGLSITLGSGMGAPGVPLGGMTWCSWPPLAAGGATQGSCWIVPLPWLFQRLSSGPYRPSWECSLSGGWCWVGSLAEGKGNGGAKPGGAVRFELVTRPAGGFAPQVNEVIRWVSPDGPGHCAGGGLGGGGGMLPRGPELLV
uniref:Uncharacterized protein n=1 Tax=Chromera velia CCMP2878 TaxID=1169474 RepID=A0A0G4HEV6_9ALVE|eukprot:Cvel_6592.t1-p1 / transcript=Cvel_6592.t1 / gene=Cvel_6592 / organism=Chromera_velia_CCMP2878 / gene_product=hypothetical protein / transcript_product=hypothetical protein / location=Cvel_scaffold325:90696-100181(-) / protein_length=205 / sequence_SO=supercontig / SO=protein_coding / is_pseudo=false